MFNFFFYEKTNTQTVAKAVTFDESCSVILSQPLEQIHPEAAALRKPSPIRDAEGQIRILLLHYKHGLQNKFALSGIFGELLQKMPDLKTVFILVQENQPLPTIDRDSLKTEIVWVYYQRDDIPELWIQDYFLVVKEEDEKLLIQPRAYTYFSNSYFPERLSRALGTKYKIQSKRFLQDESGQDIIFEGGNILVGDEFVLIGTKDKKNDIFFKTIFSTDIYYLGAYSRSRNAQSQYDQVLVFQDREIKIKNILFEFGDKDQPLYHIDLFVSLGGRDKFGIYHLIVGDPVPGFQEEDCDERTWQLMEYQLLTVKKSIDSIIADIEKLPVAFKIHRICMPLVCVDEKKEQGTYNIHRKWSFLSYNNCLVEITRTARTVWLPRYGPEIYEPTTIMPCDPIPQPIAVIFDWQKVCHFNQTASNVWTALGFHVVHLDHDFLSLAFLGGSLRCMSKVLDRFIF